MHLQSNQQPRRANVLLEFALVAFVMFLILAVTIDFGRGVVAAQVTQSSSDFIAAALAHAIVDENVQADTADVAELLKKSRTGHPNGIYSEDYLVIDLTDQAQGQNLLDYLDQKKIPSANRLLVSLMVVLDRRQNPQIPDGSRWLVYPGELEASDKAPTGFTVVVPQVDQSGNKIGTWRVVTTKAVATGDVAKAVTVTATLRYPLQAAGLSDPGNRTADGKAAMPQDAYLEVPAGEQLQSGELGGPYSGASGLGRQAAYGKTVRPYRRVIHGEAMRVERYLQ
jgi:hypothetical protein